MINIDNVRLFAPIRTKIVFLNFYWIKVEVISTFNKFIEKAMIRCDKNFFVTFGNWRDLHILHNILLLLIGVKLHRLLMSFEWKTLNTRTKNSKFKLLLLSFTHLDLHLFLLFKTQRDIYWTDSSPSKYIIFTLIFFTLFHAFIFNLLLFKTKFTIYSNIIIFVWFLE